MTVMAGFIDAHRHIINGNTDQWFAEQAAGAGMQEFLEAGYTTLMSGGGPVPGIVQLQETDRERRSSRGRASSPRRAPIPICSRPRRRRARGVQRWPRRASRSSRRASIRRPDAEGGDARRGRGRGEEAQARRDGARRQPEGDAGGGQGRREKLVHTPHFGWLTDADARSSRDAGIEMLVDDRLRRAGVRRLQQENKPTFRDGKPWPAGSEGDGRGREAGDKAVNARTLWDAGVVYGSAPTRTSNTWRCCCGTRSAYCWFHVSLSRHAGMGAVDRLGAAVDAFRPHRPWHPAQGKWPAWKFPRSFGHCCCSSRSR